MRNSLHRNTRLKLVMLRWLFTAKRVVKAPPVYTEPIPDDDANEYVVPDANPTPSPFTRVPQGEVTKYQRALVAELKNEFPYHLIKRNAETYAVVHKRAVDKMRSHGLRHVDIHKHIGHVVEMVFLPSEYDIVQLDGPNSRGAQRLRSDAEAVRVHHQWQRFLPIWVPTQVGRPTSA